MVSLYTLIGKLNQNLCFYYQITNQNSFSKCRFIDPYSTPTYSFHTKISSDGLKILIVLRTIHHRKRDFSSMKNPNFYTYKKRDQFYRKNHLFVINRSGKNIKYILTWFSTPPTTTSDSRSKANNKIINKLQPKSINNNINIQKPINYQNCRINKNNTKLQKFLKLINRKLQLAIRNTFIQIPIEFCLQPAVVSSDIKNVHSTNTHNSKNNINSHNDEAVAINNNNNNNNITNHNPNHNMINMTTTAADIKIKIKINCHEASYSNIMNDISSPSYINRDGNHPNWIPNSHTISMNLESWSSISRSDNHHNINKKSYIKNKKSNRYSVSILDMELLTTNNNDSYNNSDSYTDRFNKTKINNFIHRIIKQFQTQLYLYHNTNNNNNNNNNKLECRQIINQDSSSSSYYYFITFVYYILYYPLSDTIEYEVVSKTTISNTNYNNHKDSNRDNKHLNTIKMHQFIITNINSNNNNNTIIDDSTENPSYIKSANLDPKSINIGGTGHPNFHPQENGRFVVMDVYEKELFQINPFLQYFSNQKVKFTDEDSRHTCAPLRLIDTWTAREVWLTRVSN